MHCPRPIPSHGAGRAGLFRRRRGQTLVEYALILAVVSVLALSVFSALGNRIILVFSAITSLLDTAQAP
jgi:Flp pilus assembly pilin Flp